MEVKIRHAFLFEPEAPLDPPIFSSAKKLNRFAAKKKLMALVPLWCAKGIFLANFPSPKQKVPNLGYILNLELI